MTKPTKWHVRPVKTQISLGIRPVWSESSLSAWRKFGSLATHWAHSEDTDQTGRMPRLVWVFAGRSSHFVGFVMRRLIYTRLVIEKEDNTVVMACDVPLLVHHVHSFSIYRCRTCCGFKDNLLFGLRTKGTIAAMITKQTKNAKRCVLSAFFRNLVHNVWNSFQNFLQANANLYSTVVLTITSI